MGAHRRDDDVAKAAARVARAAWAAWAAWGVHWGHAAILTAIAPLKRMLSARWVTYRRNMEPPPHLLDVLVKNASSRPEDRLTAAEANVSPFAGCTVANACGGGVPCFVFAHVVAACRDG